MINLFFKVHKLSLQSSLQESETPKNYSSWSECSLQLRVPLDPKFWSHVDVAIWLKWASKEFQLFSDSVNQFTQNVKVGEVLTNFPFMQAFLGEWSRIVSNEEGRLLLSGTTFYRRHPLEALASITK